MAPPGAPFDDNADLGTDDEDDAEQGDEEGMTMAQMIAMNLQAMFEAPGQQALTLSTDDGEETTLLMLLTEGADQNLLCEVAANDELHPDLKLDRKTLRSLIDDAGFVEPEYRGDRLWADFGPIDDIDVDALGENLAGLLVEGFGVPNEDLSVVANVYDV